MKSYKVAANMEWTSKCNARCAMCPQHMIDRPQLMKPDIFESTLSRLTPDDLFRVVIAGYGEPTTHPKFMPFMEGVGSHSARFDMVTNGQELDRERLKHIDGKLNLLVISFSSIDSEVYQQVHINLNHERVMENIRLAQSTLKHTALGISLTPLAECLDTLSQTIDWLQKQGISLLTMSPTLYNRAGNMAQHELSTQRLRDIIAQYNLHSQEMDFIPSLGDSVAQFWNNRFKCAPRNSDLFISAGGDYLYCYNDITHLHTIGHVREVSVRQALNKREKMKPIPELCGECNLRHRYGAAELAQVAGRYLRNKTKTARRK